MAAYFPSSHAAKRAPASARHWEVGREAAGSVREARIRFSARRMATRTVQCDTPRELTHSSRSHGALESWEAGWEADGQLFPKHVKHAAHSNSTSFRLAAVSSKVSDDFCSSEDVFDDFRE
eukprot:655526_1